MGEEERSLFKKTKQKKNCTYHVSVSGSRLGKRWGFSIMDKLLIRWELGLFLWPTLPPPDSLLSIHSSLPSSATPLVCFLPKMCLIFPDWTATSENAQKNLASLCGQNTTFHLNYLINFLNGFFFCLLLLFPFIFFFLFFLSSLSAVWNTG